MQAGQELTHFRLLPGEEVRSPRVVLQFWRGGDWIRAQNLWRRWMLAHNVPRPRRPAAAARTWPPAARTSSPKCNRPTRTTKSSLSTAISRKKLPLDYWWMDAGWYINYGSWMNTGTWTVDPQRFPRGLRAISDHAHTKGVKTIVWFEPECVTPKTWIADNHPDWVLGASGWTNLGHDNAAAWCLLNLGNPDARRWLTEMLDQTISEQKIDWVPPGLPPRPHRRLACQRHSGPPRHHRDPALRRLPGQLGRTDPAPPRPPHRLLRGRRPAQ